jgi:hypothetical protein
MSVRPASTPKAASTAQARGAIRCSSRTRRDGPGPPQVIAAALDAASAALCWGTKLCGLAFSSAMHSLVGVDADDQPITPLVTWRIARPPSRPSACAPCTRSCMRGLQPRSVRWRRWRSSSGFARPSRGALLRRQRNGASGGSRSAIVSAHPAARAARSGRCLGRGSRSPWSSSIQESSPIDASFSCIRKRRPPGAPSRFRSSPSWSLLEPSLMVLGSRGQCRTPDD